MFIATMDTIWFIEESGGAFSGTLFDLYKM